LQLTTFLYLGTFLPDPLDVPTVVLERLAGQLQIAARGACRGPGRRPGPPRVGIPNKTVMKIMRSITIRTSDSPWGEERLLSLTQITWPPESEWPQGLFELFDLSL
jgi:hypothetical protein